VTSAYTNQSVARPTFKTIHVKLSEGTANMAIYWPDTTTLAPLVIIAHGFLRRRYNMYAWGQHLAKEGFVTVVPDLPSWSDHARNGHFLSDLRTYLCTDESLGQHIDPSRVGLMGFSAGGLATLLSAAGDPSLVIWIGLDPVDWQGIGAKAAPLVKCHAVVLTAEPSACNAHGNARDIIATLPRCEHFHIVGAVHVDAEWPTDWKAQVLCGRSTHEKRSEFHLRATAALYQAMAIPPADGNKESALE
jgi:hypothetical protein